ncbi:MAG: paraquat-inducible protein A [Bacteroidota bacterium]
MLRKENLPAFSLVGLLFSLAVGYAYARFIAPDTTEVTSGLLGYERESIPVFNWRGFLAVFSGAQMGVVALHLAHKSWIWAGVEAGLTVGYYFTGHYFSRTTFSGEAVASGLLGFNETATATFRTDLLLLLVVVFWGLASIVRLITDDRPDDQQWVRAPSLRLGLLLAAWGAAGTYFIGIHVPAFHSVKFWWFEDEVSLISSIDAFFKSGEAFIGAVVLTFTLVFPMVKLAYMFWALRSFPSKWSLRINKVLSILGKYSMLDVFVLALLLLNLKFDSQLIDMELEDGIIWFAISILLNLGVTSFLVLRKAPEPSETNTKDLPTSDRA